MEQATPRKLTKSILLEIFRYLTCKELFGGRLYLLSKGLYCDDTFMQSLLSQGLMYKLGVLNDYAFELEYLKETLGKERLLPALSDPEQYLRKNY